MVGVLEVVVESDDVLVLQRSVDGDLLADLLFLVGLLQLRFGDHLAGENFLSGHVLQLVAFGEATLVEEEEREKVRSGF